MKVTVLKEHFLKAVSLVSQVINPRPNLPVLGNFLLEGKPGILQITATNLETTISQKIAVKVDEVGITTAPARLLVDLCQAASGERIRLETEKDNLLVKTDAAQASLPTISAAEFPSLAGFDQETSTIFERNIWQELVSSVVFCASSEGGRPILSGIFLRAEGGNLNVVATDGYRLAKKEMKIFAKQLKPAANFQLILMRILLLALDFWNLELLKPEGAGQRRGKL